MDTLKHFLGVDFNPTKLRVTIESSFLQTSSEDINVEDDATTQPAKDNPKSGGNAPSGL